MSWPSPDGPLQPPAGSAIERILVLRTAQLREVQWVIAELRRTFPGARIAVLGTRLRALGVFDQYEQIEVAADWLTPSSVRPCEAQVRQFAPDLAVLCLNNDWFVGYGRTSRVMCRLPAARKLVATYNRRWRVWRHTDFIEGPTPLRWTINAGLILLYPLTLIYLLCKPSGPLLRPVPARIPSPEEPA